MPLIADDYLQILLGREYGSPTGWSELFADALYRCRAVSLAITYWTDYFFGVEPLIYNASSLLVHLVNVLLVAALGVWRAIGWRVSIVAAAFFAVAEGHQEAVVWYSALPELTVFTFIVAALLCWIRWLQSDDRPVVLYVCAQFLFLLALGSKESAVCLVGLQALVIGFHDWRKPKTWLALLPFVLLSCGYFLAALAARSDHLHFNDGTFSLSAPFWLTIANSTIRMLWIWGLVALGFLWLADRPQARHWTLLGLCWAVVALLPYSFLIYMDRVPSRHTYLPSVALALVVAAAGVLLWERLSEKRRLVWVTTLSSVVLLHNLAYLWTKKLRQYHDRAAPTEELIRLARETPEPIVVECFPYGPEAAELALVVGAGLSKQQIIWRAPKGCDTYSFRPGTEHAGTQPR
jgi:hypothetical protein